MRRGIRVTSTALLGLIASLAACRAIIGYESIVYTGSQEGGASDGACPTTKPAVLFTTPLVLAGLFVSDGTVYAEINNPYIETDAGFIPSQYLGLVACPETGCGGSPSELVDYTSIVDAATWGTASPTEGGFVYSLPSANSRAKYVASPGNGGVFTAEADAGDEQPVATGLNYPTLVSAAGQTIFWTDDPNAVVEGDADISYSWSVRTAQAGGSGSSSVFVNGYPGPALSLFNDSKNLYIVAVDSSYLYGLFVCPLSGCGKNALELVPNVGTLDTSDSYYGYADSFAADGENLFQAGIISGDITRYDLSTHLPTKLATAQSSPENIALSATDVYWTTPSGLIYRVAKDGSGSVTPVVCGLSNIQGLAISGTHLYFIAADPKDPKSTAVETLGI